MCNYSSFIREEGYSEGQAEGYSEANEATATRMIKAGKYSVEEISEMTGVSAEKVEELKKATENQQ